MDLSRRDALRAAGGLLAAAGVAGCVEKRVTQRTTHAESSTHWALTPDVGTALSETAFSSYVDRMADRYGESGVWGIDGAGSERFETAYVQRFAMSRRTPGDPGGTEASLVPDDVTPEAPLLITDACVAIYDAGNDRHRYWLWAAADAARGELVRRVRLDTLSTGVRTRSGSLTDAAEPSTEEGSATVSLPEGPSVQFPLRDGSLDSRRDRGTGGSYRVGWRGDLHGLQSVNGVCEVERSDSHDFLWELSSGYRFDRTE